MTDDAARRTPGEKRVPAEADDSLDDLSVEELEDVAGGAEAEFIDNTGCPNIFCLE